MSHMFVVNHIEDENKTDGLVESYQLVMQPVTNEAGEVVGHMPKRVNFVHWPKIPVPFVHEEFCEDLKFETIYIPEDDAGEEYDREELEALAADGFTEIDAEVWSNLPEGIKQVVSAFLPADEDEEESEDAEEYEEEAEEEPEE